MERISSAKVAGSRRSSSEFFHDLASVGVKAGAVHAETIAMEVPGGQWTYEAVQALLSLAREGVPVSVISLKLKRSVTEVRAKLDDLGVTPTAEV
jgi:hypothetical protein